MYEMNKRYIHSYERTKDLLNTSEILTSVFTHWYWSTITVTSDSRIRPIVYTIRGAHLYLF